MGWYLLTFFIISVVLQIVVFTLAYIKQTDKLTDIAYGVGFIALNIIALIYTNTFTLLAIIPTILITLWGIRLSIYLFVRILTMGRDKRFDGIREKGISFLKFFLLQGIAVWALSIPSLIITFVSDYSPNQATQTIGLLLFSFGLLTETIADYQKFKFKQAGNKNWIDTGIWKFSRHPNYFGEMVVWWGIYVYVIGTTSQFWALGLISPVFITLLLRFVSGIPPLEKRYAKKYKGNKKYKEYIKKTNLLIPLPKLK